MADKGNAGNGRRPAKKSPALLEWVLGAAGLLLLLASIAWLAYRAATGPAGPPVPSAEVVGIEQQGPHFLVRVRVVNRGDTTGASLRITGSLRKDGAILERTEAVLDYLPAGSTREAGIFFSRDPRQHELVIAPAGYEKP